MINPITGKPVYTGKVTSDANNTPGKSAAPASSSGSVPTDQITLSPEVQKLMNGLGNVSDETLQAVIEENFHAAASILA